MQTNRSTGPRTEEGKKRSSLNAMRHGLTSQIVVLPTEDMDAYLAHSRRFESDFAPQGAVETHLAQTLADAAWRLARVRSLEHSLLALGFTAKSGRIVTEHPEVHAALATADGLRLHNRELANLSIHELRLTRQFDKTLAQLRQLQAERKAAEAEMLAEAARLYLAHNAAEDAKSNKLNRIPYSPQDDGFVFTISQIELHVRRTQRRPNRKPPQHAAAA